MSLSLVLKAMARLPGFSSKLHKPVVRASLRVAEDPSDGGLRSGPLGRSRLRPVRECRRRLAIVRSRRWGSLRPWIEFISDISRSPPKSLSSWAYQLRASTK